MTAYQMIFGSIGLLCIGALQVGVMPFTFSLHALLMLIYLSFFIRSWFLHLEYNYEIQTSWKSIYVYVLYTRIWCVIIEHDLGEVIHSFVLLGLACSRGNYCSKSDASYKTEQEKQVA